MYDDTIGCDGSECQIQWFHLLCVNLTKDQLLDGDWFYFIVENNMYIPICLHA